MIVLSEKTKTTLKRYRTLVRFFLRLVMLSRCPPVLFMLFSVPLGVFVGKNGLAWMFDLDTPGYLALKIFGVVCFVFGSAWICSSICLDYAEILDGGYVITNFVRILEWSNKHLDAHGALLLNNWVSKYFINDMLVRARRLERERIRNLSAYQRFLWLVSPLPLKKTLWQLLPWDQWEDYPGYRELLVILHSLFPEEEQLELFDCLRKDNWKGEALLTGAAVK